MVSTRGPRYKFSEGERVLCYEPDPTKAKVLYDSKVLEVIESKDKRGRRTVEYLIHFQGWNSSWDRCVSEDFVLKDTEENRQLQRDLAEKSQLQLGAYLYRRERKKGSTSNPSGGPAKRARHGFSDDGSSSSTQPDEGEVGDTDSSSASGGSAQPSPASPAPPAPPAAPAGRAHITLPSALRDRLTFDYHLVVKRGRVSRLPAAPCAAHILESFVKWFARAGAWNPARARDAPHAPPHPAHRPDMLDVTCRLNLVREIADGLRVYFDFILRGHLLYKQEINQYHEMCGMHFDDAQDIKSEPEDEENQSQDDGNTESVEEDLKSPKIPEYSHLPPDPVDKENGEAIFPVDMPEIKKEILDPSPTNYEEPEKIEVCDKKIKIEPPDESPPPSQPPTLPPAQPAAQNNGERHEKIKEEKVKEVRSAPRSGNLARRLRSHKSAVSQSENDEPTPSTSTGEQRTFETHSSSSAGSSGGSSLSEGWPPAPPPPAAPTRTPLSLLLDKVSKWQIIPREESTEQLPCRVYGAIHLARLFVKLPDFLNAAQMPDFKLKLILKHIDLFVQYLDEHSEWFGEMFYIADSVSRSH